MEFESRLAKRIVERKNGRTPLRAGLVAFGALAIVLTLASAGIGSSQGVIMVSSKTSLAEFLGTFDGVQNVIMIEVSTSQDLVAIKTPLKGHLSGLDAISYKLFVSQTGGDGPHEPFVVIKLTAARSLICQPTDSYAAGGWSLPFLEWQLRDVVAGGLWTLKPSSGLPLLAPLTTWIANLGDPQVVGLSVVAGHWQTPNPFECDLGDLSVNGVSIGIANAKRTTGSITELLSDL